MLKSGLCLAALCGILAVAPGSAASREYSQVVTVNDYTYEIEVGGFRDPVNESIIIENLGDKPLVNPRITVNGRYDWFDVETMAREATAGCKTDEERALALWDFVRNNFQHLDSPGDREAHNPVVALNIYGYANCAYHSSVFVSLCRSLGIEARVWEVYLHTVSEARYNNAWHMLDSDIGLYFLTEDNRTLASIEQLWADQLVSGGTEEGAKLTRFSTRNKAVRSFYNNVEGSENYLNQDGTRERGYRYFHGADECYVQTGYDRFTYEPHNMAMTLRPSEKLIRGWKGGDKFYDFKRHNAAFESSKARYTKPILYGVGQLVWKPDLNAPDAPLYVNQDLPPAFKAQDGVSPAIHVRHKQGGIYELPDRIMFDVKTPYTILGGKLKAKVYRGAATRSDRIAILVYSPTGPVSESAWRVPDNSTGSLDAEVSLDEILYPGGERGRHEYTVEFNLMANEKNDPPTQTGIESVELVTDIQCASNSLPALALGRNVIRYRDETPGPHRVKITHVWNERTDNHPPLAPQKPVYPADGATVADLAPLFRWQASRDEDKDDKVADHCLVLSFDPQCRWPVATALWKDTGSGKPEWRIDKGWLNGDTAYYWKVQAQDSRGVWGDWSPVFRFRTAAK
jgi:hypothetical protein